MELRRAYTVLYEGNEYVGLKGYPTFAFRYDEKTGKYAIASCKILDPSTNNKIKITDCFFNVAEDHGYPYMKCKIEVTDSTEPFVDEIIYSEVPLESWTANYIVVRIGENYYLSDNKGNCYYKCDKPFIICRNVFVTDNMSRVINCNMDECAYPDSIIVRNYGEYNFAFVIRRQIWIYDEFIDCDCLLDIYGHDNCEMIKEEAKYLNKPKSISYKGLHNWYMNFGKKIFFINKLFQSSAISFNSVDITDKIDEKVEKNCLGKKSKVYLTDNYDKFSTYFGDYVTLYRYDKLEIVIFNGCTYFFKPDGEIEELRSVISNPKSSGCFCVYYYDNKMVMRYIEDGTIYDQKRIEPIKLYEILLLEELNKSR